MAYDRYDTRGGPRGRGRDDRYGRDQGRDRERGGWFGGGDDRGRDERGFFDRAGDEIASWFGGDDDRDREHGRGRERGGGGGWFGGGDDRGREYGRDRGRGGWFGGGRDEPNPDDRYGVDRVFGERDGPLGSDGYRRGGGPGSDRATAWGRSGGGTGDDGGAYRPMAGDYGRFDPQYRDMAERGGDSPRERYRGDREYAESRRRHMEELDRDYDDYCRERQSRFEEDFGGWRQRRQQKRGLLGQIREHMEVVGSDDQHVGTVDRVAGDRIILTKSDPESGGTHHSLSCTDIDRVEKDKVILDLTADKARERWRDDSRERALFEREDQGQAGPHMLDRSFSGTYRDR